MVKTISEIFFEQFCTQHRIRWEPITSKATAGEKTPDYAIFPNDTKVIAEIKEIQENVTERHQRETLAEVGWSMFGERGVKVGDRCQGHHHNCCEATEANGEGKVPGDPAPEKWTT